MSQPSINPPDQSPQEKQAASALELIRAKVSRAYGEEPNAIQHMSAAKKDATPSKHQLYMRELSASGKSLADIQVAWHAYYQQLPAAEKKVVWEEFYEINQHTPYQKLFQNQSPVASRQRLQTVEAIQPTQSLRQTWETPLHTTTSSTGITVSGGFAPEESTQKRSAVKNRLKQSALAENFVHSTAGKKTKLATQKVANTLSANGKLSIRHHVQSLLFGLGMGMIVLIVLLFGFFNEYILAPFIQPSRKVTAAPVIVSNTTAAQAAQPTVIIPKINIQIPVDFNLPAIDEGTVQSSLENGVVHYPSTVLPGQNGNGAYFGHSSSNIFNSGKYKFAFVLLHQLTTGDIFYITYNGKVYAYQVFAREIVPPTQISVLNDTKGKQATAALITCDPPGLSTNRLVVWGEQISPSITTNTAPAPRADIQPQAITSNGPTLWTRIWRSLTGTD